MTSTLTRSGSSTFEISGVKNGVAGRPRSASLIERRRKSLMWQLTADCGEIPRQRGLPRPTQGAMAQFGGVTVDFSRAEAYRNGAQIRLTAHEFRALKYFIDNPRRVRDAVRNHPILLQNLVEYR